MFVRSKYLTDPVLVLFVIGFIHGSEAAYLRCYRGALENPLVTPLESPLALIEDMICIDKGRVTVFFVHGYNQTVTSPESIAIQSAYIFKGDVNMLLVDWADEARYGLLGKVLGYPRAINNAEKIGKQFATALLALAAAGLDLNKLHLVGHSLGAQLIGITGNEIQSKGGHIARITGLDPAKVLLFDRKGLNHNSAMFVDIIHSDPGQYGIANSKGTVDFWPNYKGGISVQPGCPIGIFPLLSDESKCSHDRSWMYFRESIFNKFAFPAASEPDYDTWIQTNGTTDTVAYMGEYVSLEARGNFYLVTNDQDPFGKGDEGLRPNKIAGSERENTT